MTIFQKYDCGCIGIPVGEKHCILIEACDREIYADPISFFYRDMGNKTSTPLTKEEEELFVNEIGGLISLGYSMKSLASTINRASQINSIRK